jgi:uncharacterized damage-inducible protein DinB
MVIMNKELLSILKNFETTLNGQPWFGRAVYELLDETDESKVSIKPGDREHSLLELIWHMNTWAAFVLAHLEERTAEEIKTIEANDWRTIDTGKHSWQNGVAELKSVHKQIADRLAAKDDSFLKEMVSNRPFNFRFMLNGLIQHNIYHAGQIAYLNKMLA